MAGPVTLACPRCREVFTIPTQVVKILGHTVLVRMDRREAYEHMAGCTGPTAPAPAPEQGGKTVAVPEQSQPDPELAGRIHMMLAGGHFMAKGGSGACTMCGVNRDACLQGLQTGEQIVQDGHRYGPPACCGACQSGNTHPAPHESRGTCAEWGAEHGARN